MSRVLLCCAASAALHKGCDLASKLTQASHQVRTILTPRAARLVAPQLFEALTGEPAYVDEFAPERRGAMDHVDLAAWAQIAVVAPCSADLAGRLALGLGDDLVTTTLLALPAGVPRLVAPAMNPSMLAHPAVARNLATLRADGWRVLEPAEGRLACRDEGPGRLPEPETVIAAVADLLGR